MHKTPIKSELNSSTFTPVKFIDSPKQKSDPSGVQTRLVQIAKTLYENHQKWEAAQKRGTVLCRSIEAIKTPAIESKSDDKTLYPEELKSPCDKLRIVTSIFDDISASTKQSLKHLKALLQLNEKSDEVVQLKTWSIADVIKLAEMAADLYEKEIAVKRIVTEEIAHATCRPDLVLHSSIWEYPAFADENLWLRFKFLGIEIDAK